MMRENGSSEPLVTIGMPVFNGATSIAAAINSILDQTFRNFELVISDNCSTDDTAEICKRYAKIDNRIRYVRQDSNVGASLNFSYLAKQARGAYFMWAAADDIRSPDFLEHNVRFLTKNHDYVASVTPNRFETRTASEEEAWIDFSITGSFENRLMLFLDTCWDSNGIFYSLMRTDVIRDCSLLGENFLGFDWAIDVFLIKHGKVHRTSHGYLILGRNGSSNSINPWRLFRTSSLSWVFPFYRFSLFTLGLTSGCKLGWRIALVLRLLRLNFCSAYEQLYAGAFECYLKYLRPRLKKS